MSGKILGATYQAGYFLDGLKLENWPYAILDILIVTFLLYSAYLLIRETRAIRILYGLIVLIILMGLGYLLNLALLNWMLKYVMTMLVVAIPIVFQPELRNALERLGRTGIIRELSNNVGNNGYLDELLSTLDYFAKERIGALIVFQRQTGLRDYIERGVAIQGKISRNLLMSIFYPKSPLHDGAVVIADGKIEAASVMLPVAEGNFSIQMGSRHRAAIGITENSDAVAVIVSEESGSISLAYAGKIDRRIALDKLKSKLNRLII